MKPFHSCFCNRYGYQVPFKPNNTVPKKQLITAFYNVTKLYLPVTNSTCLLAAQKRNAMSSPTITAAHLVAAACLLSTCDCEVARKRSQCTTSLIHLFKLPFVKSPINL